MVWKSLHNLVYRGSKFIIDTTIQFFFHKFTRSLSSSKLKSTIETDLYSHYCHVQIHHFSMDMNGASRGSVRKVELRFYPHYRTTRMPRWIVIISHPRLVVDRSLFFSSPQNGHTPMTTEWDTNLESYFHKGCQTMARLLTFFTQSVIVKIEHAHIDICHALHCQIPNTLLRKQNHTLTSTITQLKLWKYGVKKQFSNSPIGRIPTITTSYHGCVFAPLKNHQQTPSHDESLPLPPFQFHIPSIHCSPSVENVKTVYEFVSTLPQSESTTYSFSCTVAKLNLHLNWWNHFNWILHKVSLVNTCKSTLQIQYLSLRSFTRTVLKMFQIKHISEYNLTSQWTCAKCEVHLYDSFMYRVYQSLVHLVSKRKRCYHVHSSNTMQGFVPSLAEYKIENYLNESENRLPCSRIQTSTEDGILDTSFRISKHSETFIEHATHLLQQLEPHTKVYFQKIRFEFHPNKIHGSVCSVVVQNLEWKVSSTQTDILVQDLQCLSPPCLGKHRIVLERLDTTSSVHILHIVLSQQHVYCTVSNLKLNLIFEYFSRVAHSIATFHGFVSKLLYYDFDKEFTADAFCMQYFLLNRFTLKITYLPIKCDYYSILTGKLTQLYTALQYKNLNLKMPEVELFYPADWSDWYQYILKVWVNDIYKHQLQSVLKGVRLRPTVKLKKIMHYFRQRSRKLFQA